MCTSIGFWRSVAGYDLVVGMNRDESVTRPADPPAILEGETVIVAPRDRKAGGTWIGVNGTGLVVALSNRRGHNSPTAKSRGQLVLEALRQPSVAGVDVFLQQEVRKQEYNFWNLFVASRKDLRFLRYDGGLASARGHDGLNVLTNEGGNVLSDPKVQLIQGLIPKIPADVSDAVRALQDALRTHATGPSQVALCFHGAGVGTVSSTILGLSNSDPDENLLLYAEGPPCSSPYRDYHDVIRKLPSPG